MAEITILEEMLLDSFAEQEPGLWGFDTNVEIGLVVGETYRVIWDNDEYSCTAVEVESGPVAIGNLALGGLEGGNNEPFLMFTMQLDENVYMFAIVTEQEGSSHRVGIYQTAEAETVPSATVKIKGYSGAEFEYQNVPKVWLAAPESTVDNPVLVPFTYGEAVDNVQIVPDFSSGDHTLKMPAGEMARSAVVKKPDGLIPGNIKAGETVAGITGEYEGEVPETEELTAPADFSAGDMVLVPAEGKYLERATVQMPTTLIPENIAEGVDIAGIIGSFIGGRDIKIASGTLSATSSSYNLSHGLGTLPDIVILSAPNAAPSTGGIEVNIGFLKAFARAHGIKVNRMVIYVNSSGARTGWRIFENTTEGAVNGNSDIQGAAQVGMVGWATATEFTVPGTSVAPIIDGTRWVAIAGLN